MIKAIKIIIYFITLEIFIFVYAGFISDVASNFDNGTMTVTKNNAKCEVLNK